MSISINDIAEKAGVSKATVSRVMNNLGNVREETRQKVLQVMNSMGYTPNAAARSLATNDSTVIGVILPDLDNALYAKIFKGISKTAFENNLNTMLCLTEKSPEKELQHLSILNNHRAYGVLLYSSLPDDSSLDEPGQASDSYKGPMVMMGRDSLYCKCDSVVIDDFRGAFEATRALVRAGHRSIGIMTGDLRLKAANDRLDGYKAAMSRSGLEVREEFILQGDFTIEAGSRMANAMMSMPQRPSALFTSDNQITIGCMRYFYSAHLNVPNDIAVMAFDDGDVLQMFGVGLSVVSIDPVQLGQAAVQTLINRKQNQLDLHYNKLMISPGTVLRGSEILA